MPTKELTDIFCKSAKPIGGKQTDYFDTNTTGLCLTVSPGGTQTWNVFYTKPIDGKRARMKIGRYPEIKLAAARVRAQEKRASATDGGDPIAEKKAKAASLTVGDLVADYLTRSKVPQRRSAREVERRLRKNVVDLIGSVKAADLRKSDIIRCLDPVVDRGARVEANRLFAELRAMIRWAHGERGALDTNVMAGMKPPTDEMARERSLVKEEKGGRYNYDEISTLWAALPTADMVDATRDILRLCLITGQRVGEIAGMTLDEIDLGLRVWEIPASRVKNGRKHGGHTVPLSPLAIKIIEGRIDAAQKLSKRKGREVPRFIFPAPGGRAAMSGGAVPKAVKRQEKNGKTLGIDPWVPHDLRRSAATGMAAIGVPGHVIARVLNHVGIAKAGITDRVYNTYTYQKEMREALDRWADHLAAIIEGARNVVLLRAVKA